MTTSHLEAVSMAKEIVSLRKKYGEKNVYYIRVCSHKMYTFILLGNNLGLHVENADEIHVTGRITGTEFQKWFQETLLSLPNAKVIIISKCPSTTENMRSGCTVGKMADDVVTCLNHFDYDMIRFKEQREEAKQYFRENCDPVLAPHAVDKQSLVAKFGTKKAMKELMDVLKFEDTVLDEICKQRKVKLIRLPRNLKELNPLSSIGDLVYQRVQSLINLEIKNKQPSDIPGHIRGQITKIKGKEAIRKALKKVKCLEQNLILSADQESVDDSIKETGDIKLSSLSFNDFSP
ncbi:hypothetical protein HDE_01237 [Halotydeus destructor]|nr:hypothetical protein HDE_01237 [Halotydeus destructor]